MAALPSNPFTPPLDADGELMPGDILTQMQEFERIMSPSTQAMPLDMSQAMVDHVLNRMGAALILEDLARGNLPNALAIRYNVPVIKFRRWLERNTTAEDLSEAMTYAAESMVVKAHTVLTHEPASGPAGAMVRAFADRAMEIAGKLQPVEWGNQKEQQGAGNAIQINIVGDIPGLEALKSANPAPTPLPIPLPTRAPAPAPTHDNPFYAKKPT
jgi:hypothetical protein